MSDQSDILVSMGLDMKDLKDGLNAAVSEMKQFTKAAEDAKGGAAKTEKASKEAASGFKKLGDASWYGFWLRRI